MAACTKRSCGRNLCAQELGFQLLGTSRAFSDVMLPQWARLAPQLPALLEEFGPRVCSDEPQFDGEKWLHITASARVWNRGRTRVLKVWSAKEARWLLPFAHGEGDFDLGAVALRVALRALGEEPRYVAEASDYLMREVGQYWNTPAHQHLEIVWEFEANEGPNLPRGSRWFDANNE